MGWHNGAPPVAAGLVCEGGAVHRALWRRGSLVLLDHDVRAELAVVALGGDPPPCVALLLAWRDRDLWRDATHPPGPGFTRTAVRRPTVPPALADVRLAGALVRVERAWARKGFGGVDEGVLFRNVRDRALGPLVDALVRVARPAGAAAPPSAEVRLARPGAPATVTGRVWSGGARVTVALRPAWVGRVGPANAVDAEGRFVVDRSGSSVTVVEWRRQGPDLVPVLRVLPAGP